MPTTRPDSARATSGRQPVVPVSADAPLGAGVMDEADFAAIARHIHRETGIVISPAKRSMLVSRLSRRLRQLNLGDFAAYAALIASPEGEGERQALISAITTNVTGFFREPHHFTSLAELLPDLIARARSGGRVRLWSAGCSTGQEPYSIAATILEQAPDAARHDIRILATDIDPAVIDEARRGVYPSRSIGENLPPAMTRLLSRGPGRDTYTVDDAARRLIRFEVLNLLHPWPFNGQFDVIFCRNVVIYFDRDTRVQLWTRFAERLPPGSTLFLGHSERMDTQIDALFTPCGLTQYRRSGVPVPDARRRDPAHP
jgi:chemotaxis protein methyltransferase CheR